MTGRRKKSRGRKDGEGGESDQSRGQCEPEARLVRQCRVVDRPRQSGGSCPCCDPAPRPGAELSHSVILVEAGLCVIDAMTLWKKECNQRGAKLGASNSHRTFHDERLCSKLDSCHQFRKDPCMRGLIDPTRYFIEESLGKLKDAEFYARYGFDKDPSDDETLIDETESESETELASSNPRCRCCDPKPEHKDFTFEHLHFTCSKALSVREAMSERTESMRCLGDPHTNRALHNLVQSYHDERSCEKLPSCGRYRNQTAKDGRIDPTRYFCEEKLGRVDQICDYYESIVGTEDSALQRYVLSETTPMFSSEVQHYGKFRTENKDWLIVTRAPVKNALYHLDPKFKPRPPPPAVRNDQPEDQTLTNKTLAGITYNLKMLKIESPGKAVRRMAIDGSGIRDFCPCCDQNTLEFAPGLKYAHSQFTITRDEDPIRALDAREAFMIKETIEVRRQFFPQKVRATIHDDRICANLPSCQEFKAENRKRSVDPTRYFTDLKSLCEDVDLSDFDKPSIEVKIDFDNLRCPCCERDHVHEENDHGFEHIQYHVPAQLSLHQAMLKRHQLMESYDSPQRFYRPVQLNFHDERLCLKLDNCVKDLRKEEDGYIDPTRYFTDKNLSKYQSMTLKELKLNNGVQNQCFEDGSVSYREQCGDDSETEGRVDVSEQGIVVP